MDTAKLDMMPVDELKIGMYVEKLDRPWTDTPFLFQGFFVHRQDELETLKRYCRHVFVDRRRTRDGEARSTLAETHGAERTFTPVVDVHAEAPRPPAAHHRRHHESYPVPLAMEEELDNAHLVHEEAREAAKTLVVQLMDEKRLDMDTARGVVDPILDSVLRNPDALIWLARMHQHDAYIYRHALDCCIWGLAFARHLGLEKQALYEIGLGCLLFDVGKTRLPHGLLTKHDDLTPGEREEVQAHVAYGLTLLDSAKHVPLRAREALRTHHERFDGSGYPAGLKGDEIPTEGKIAGMVDCYDALTNFRPQAADPLSPDAALRKLYTWRGTLFQPEVVEHFMQVVGVFPTGSLIEFNTGAIGVVIGQNERRLRPRVALLLNEHKRDMPFRHVVDLAHDRHWNEPKEIWIERCLQAGAHGLRPEKYLLL